MDSDFIQGTSSIRKRSVLSFTVQPYYTQSHDVGPLVFEKPKSTWTEDDIKEAINIVKEVPFFSSMHKNDDEMGKLLHEALGAMECKTFKQGEIVFHQRDKISEFYIIIEGNVDIYVPKTEEEMNEEIRQLETNQETKSHDFCEIPQSSKRHRISQIILPNGVSSLAPEETKSRFKSKQLSKSMKNVKLSCEIKSKTINSLLVLQDCFQMHQGQMLFRLKNRRTLGPGAHFGELALANNCAKSITVVAASDLTVATLSKESFKKICDESDKDFQNKINFFSKLIGKTSSTSVARFCYGFKERQYSYEQKIFVQGQIPSEVFIVKHGEVQITNHEPQEKVGSKMRKSSFEKIANLGPYNFVATGGLSETQPYRMTATSCSHDLVLYVIPIKEFQNLRTSYHDVFERFLDKFSTQSCYFEERADNVCSINKKIHHLHSLSGNIENKPLKTLPLLNLHEVHTPRLIENNTPQSPSAKIGFLKGKISILTRHGGFSPQFSPAEFHVNSPLSSKNNPRPNPSLKEEAMKRTSSKEKQSFGDYIDHWIHPQDNKSHKRSSKLSSNLPKGVHGAQGFHDREFKIETTIKLLVDHARMKRNSWDLALRSPFLKEHSPMSIFKDGGQCNDCKPPC